MPKVSRCKRGLSRRSPCSSESSGWMAPCISLLRNAPAPMPRHILRPDTMGSRHIHPSPLGNGFPGIQFSRIAEGFPKGALLPRPDRRAKRWQKGQQFYTLSDSGSRGFQSFPIYHANQGVGRIFCTSGHPSSLALDRPVNRIIA